MVWVGSSSTPQHLIIQLVVTVRYDGVYWQLFITAVAHDGKTVKDVAESEVHRDVAVGVQSIQNQSRSTCPSAKFSARWTRKTHASPPDLGVNAGTLVAWESDQDLECFLAVCCMSSFLSCDSTCVTKWQRGLLSALADGLSGRGANYSIFNPPDDLVLHAQQSQPFGEASCDDGDLS